ncbi:MAG: hypothetical protein ACO2PN_14950, partial [Pyrobaculum sp.]
TPEGFPEGGAGPSQPPERAGRRAKGPEEAAWGSYGVVSVVVGFLFFQVMNWLVYRSVLPNTFATHKTSTSYHLWRNQVWRFHFELKRRTFSEQLLLGSKLRRTLQPAN